MLQHMLDWAEVQGIPYLRLDASDAGFPLYLQFGFEVLDQALMFRHPDFSPLSDYPQQVRLLKSQDIQALADFDTPIFGADRAGLFQALLTDFPDRGFAAYDASGDMAGYLFAQTQRLGPWAARSQQDAEALLQAALTLSYKGVPLVIAPGTNTAASDLLGRYGFRHDSHKPPHAAGPVGHTRTAHGYLWRDQFCDRLEPKPDKPRMNSHKGTKTQTINVYY